MEFIIQNASWLALMAALVGLAFSAFTANWILQQDTGTDRMRYIAGAIQRGAQAFLRREYRYVAIVVAGVFILLLVLSIIPHSGMSPYTAVAYLLGALASAYIGLFPGPLLDLVTSASTFLR